jgi:hypothetical protein
MKQQINLKVMKTNTQISALLIIIAVMFTVNTFAKSNSFAFEDEAYINDIPFSTEIVVNELINPEFKLQDESYINDIPFNTKAVVTNYNYTEALLVVFELEEENLIEDIPFNTGRIAENHNYTKAMSVDFLVKDEEYINDIPFDTYEIANNYTVLTTSNLYASGR